MTVAENLRRKGSVEKGTAEASVLIGGTRYELPMRKGTLGPDVVDVGTLYQDTGCFTYDPGFTSTASCESKITFIDFDKGIVLYRGYPIEQLAEHSTFLETCYLLLYGELPTAQQYEAFERRIVKYTMVHEQMTRFYSGFRRDAHPMAVMVGVVGALSAFYHDSIDIKDPAQREMASVRMIGKMPTIAAMAYKYSIGQPFIYPRNELNYSANFLHMCFAVPSEEYEVDPALASAMRQFFILHADHEQSASTATVRLAGSSGANPYACISAGIACLWGARRCQRGGAADVEGDRHGRPHPGIHQARQGRERSVPSSWVLAIACTRAMTQERRSCGRPCTRCSKPWVVTIATTRSLRWRLSSSASRSPMITSSRRTFLPISTSIRGSR